MFALRSARAVAGRRITERISPIRRRMGSTTSHGHHDHHHGPVEETFPKSFYLSIAAIVGVLAAYKLEQRISGSQEAPLTRLINYYSDLHQIWVERNTRHTAMVEQAGKDKSLFDTAKKSGVINLKFVEAFNHGSPYNNEAGWSGGNLTAVKEYLEGQRKAIVKEAKVTNGE